MRRKTAIVFTFGNTTSACTTYISNLLIVAMHLYSRFQQTQTIVHIYRFSPIKGVISVFAFRSDACDGAHYNKTFGSLSKVMPPANPKTTPCSPFEFGNCPEPFSAPIRLRAC